MCLFHYFSIEGRFACIKNDSFSDVDNLVDPHINFRRNLNSSANNLQCALILFDPARATNIAEKLVFQSVISSLEFSLSTFLFVRPFVLGRHSLSCWLFLLIFFGTGSGKIGVSV